MSEAMQQGLQKRQGLTQMELIEIEHIAHICNTYEGLDLKLNFSILRDRPKTQTDDFLYYADGNLVGFLPLFSFNGQEAEFSGMVHPQYRRQGIFTSLFNAAREECQHRGLSKILLIVPSASQGGQAFARQLATSYDHSEYKMVWDREAEAALSTQFQQPLEFRRARNEDIPMLGHITAISFDMPETNVNWYTPADLEKMDRALYVALLDGATIGKIDVRFDTTQALIYGFGVLPAYRGKGYGRQILARTMREILARGQRNIMLEVLTENKRALSLYQSCGFKETSSDDYYRLALEK